jgi:hypothetical protein
MTLEMGTPSCPSTVRFPAEVLVDTLATDAVELNGREAMSALFWAFSRIF